MDNTKDMNVAPADAGYQMMKNPSRWFMGAIAVSAAVSCFVPKDYEIIRQLAFGAQMLLVGIIVGHNAPMWSKPKRELVKDNKPSS